MRRRRGGPWLAALTAAILGGLAAACGSSSEPPAEPTTVTARRIALAPTAAPIEASFLAGTLAHMTVVQRVDPGTGRPVDAPRLQASLTLKNVARDRAARLIMGEVSYRDPQGRVLDLPPGRQDTSFRFHGFSSDRLDPGQAVTTSVDVPFPAAALDEPLLHDLRLRLVYVLLPYREESLEVPVSVAR